MTGETDIRRWFDARSVTSRRVMRFGAWSLISAVAVSILHHVIWLFAGWGSANFVPGWALVPIYVFAILAGLAMAYLVIARTAGMEGKVQWPGAVLVGVVTVGFVVGALAGSLPQLSTLVFSRPVVVDLTIHQSRDSRHCPGGVGFGPLYRVSGRYCTGARHWPLGSTFAFEGHGHAWAVRLVGW